MSTFKNFVTRTCHVIRKCGFQSSYQNRKLLSAIGSDLCSKNQTQNFHSGTPRMAQKESIEIRKSAVQEARAEGRVKIDESINETLKREEGFFPKGDLSNTVINGMIFKEIPIVLVLARKNNTIIQLIDKGRPQLIRSCGIDGFKNARKGTNVAAQNTGVGFGLRALKNGYRNVRAIVKGIGPGRLSALKGLELAGVNVVSITDDTTVETSMRPRKQRRV